MGEPMETEMVERVAKAMHDADWRQQIGLTEAGEPRCWETNPEKNWWRTMARAAIAAMREPTGAMVIAGCRHENMGDMAGRWRAMIDEALK